MGIIGAFLHAFVKEENTAEVASWFLDGGFDFISSIDSDRSGKLRRKWSSIA
jgi:hypothetical protein